MDHHQELLNVYDAEGRVVGALPRREAKASGQAVGAVNVLIANRRGEVLLQHRPADKENGGRWDKSVGGHVAAGEAFDQTAVRECGEELFDDGASPAVQLARDAADLAARAAAADLSRTVLLRPAARHLNLRDVRVSPSGSRVNVIYHVAIYYGLSQVPLAGFHPQADEIQGLRWAAAEEVDALLLQGALAPNMAFLWLGHAHALLQEARR